MRSWDDYKKTMRSESIHFGHARSGDLESLKFHLNPSLLNVQDTKGYSALMLAAYNGHIESTRWLIDAGATVNQSDNSGNTILMGAAFKGHLEIVKMLVDAGADINAINPNGQNALQFAQMFGRTEVVLYLKSKLNKPEIFGLKDLLSSWSSYVFSKRRPQ